LLVSPAVLVEIAATAAYFGGCYFVLRYLRRLLLCLALSKAAEQEIWHRCQQE
jgi:hypothetical protein